MPAVVSRRAVLGGTAAAGALLVAGSGRAFAEPLGNAEPGLAGDRASRLRSGVRLVHADLHNHSVQSDGDGDPALAFDSMRRAGLDVAALTDHTSVSYGLPGSPCLGNSECQGLAGLNDATWDRTMALADAALADGSFVALRGFEWSSPTLGHVNVWFTERYTDPLHTAGIASGTEPGRLADEFIPGLGPAARALLEPFLAGASGGVSMAGFYDWLQSEPSRPVLGGGMDGLAGFNHPAREPGVFADFAYEDAVGRQLVSMEIFNRGEDYLFETVDRGRVSPLVLCLDAGWRTGLTGVTDEHGTNWGFRELRGRTGIYVPALNRAAVRSGLESRGFFASLLDGLRIDGAMDGALMGSDVSLPAARPVTFQLDVDRGPDWVGKALLVQVLVSGRPLPRVLATVPVTVPSADQPVISFSVPVGPEDGRWVVLRVVDPDPPRGGDGQPLYREDSRAPRNSPYAGVGPAIAYTSPFFLVDAPAPVIPEVPAAVLLPAAAAVAAGVAVYAAHSHGHAHSHEADSAAS